MYSRRGEERERRGLPRCLWPVHVIIGGQDSIGGGLQERGGRGALFFWRRVGEVEGGEKREGWREGGGRGAAAEVA